MLLSQQIRPQTNGEQVGNEIAVIGLWNKIEIDQLVATRCVCNGIKCQPVVFGHPCEKSRDSVLMVEVAALAL